MDKEVKSSGKNNSKEKALSKKKHNKKINKELEKAAKNGEYEKVQTLLDENFKEEEINKEKALDIDNALFFAAKNGHYEIVEILLDKNPDKKIMGSYTLCIAAKKGYTKIVEAILKKDLNEEDIDQATLNAEAEAHCDTLKVFLEKNPKQKIIDTALYYSALHGKSHCEVVKILLEKNPSQQGIKEALEIAAIRGHCETLKILLEQNPDKESISIAFLEAAKYKKVKAVKILLDKDPKENCINTALHDAVDKDGSYKIIKMLLDKNPRKKTINQAILRADKCERNDIIELCGFFGITPNRDHNQNIKRSLYIGNLAKNLAENLAKNIYSKITFLMVAKDPSSTINSFTSNNLFDRNLFGEILKYFGPEVPPSLKNRDAKELMKKANEFLIRHKSYEKEEIAEEKEPKPENKIEDAHNTEFNQKKSALAK